MVSQNMLNATTEVKVQRINNNFHARLFVNGKLYDEMACKEKQDIGWICREMMRWADKDIVQNMHTSSARRRHNEDSTPIGKVYYRNALYKLQKHKKK